MKRLIDFPEYECTKCGWIWMPRTREPLSCPNPKCRSLRWNENRDEKGFLPPTKRKGKEEG